LGEHGLQFREFLFGGVVARQARRSFELADPGVQRRGLVMRRAELAQPGVRIKLQMALESSRNARLADARLAGEDHHPSFAGLDLLPAPEQQLELLGPANERRPA
jgi:hypothetical protein